MNRILIVEDEATISRLIEVSLTRAGYACTVANDGLAAADQIEQQDFDLALLDIMLPGLDGYELLDYLRPLGTPVIFITAKGTTKDRVKGLSRGADDYLVKPFEVEELLARVGAVLRRTGRGGQLLTAFGVTLDVSGRSVTQDGNPVELTPREFALLEKIGFTRIAGSPEELQAAEILKLCGFQYYVEYKDRTPEFRSIDF